MGECEDLAALHLTVAGDYRIAKDLAVGQSEVGGPVGDEGIQFFKCALVHKQGQPLTGGQLAPAMLLVYPVLASAFLGFLAHSVQGVNLLVDLPFSRGHCPSRRVSKWTLKSILSRILDGESQVMSSEISPGVMSSRVWLIVADPSSEEQ